MSAPAEPQKTGFIGAIIAWFDTSDQDLKGTPEEEKVEFLRCMPFFLMHAACLAPFIPGVGWSWTAMGVCVFLYFARMFAITGFYHRYFSHRTFKTTRAFQFIMALWGASCVQRGALWWAAHHRHHHRHSDTDPDFHSPGLRGFIWSHMLWLTTRRAFRTNTQEVKDLAKFPELMFLDRFDVLVPILFAAGMFGLGALLQYLGVEQGHGVNGPQMLVWGFFISTVLLYHGTFTINSLSHRFGSQRYETKDDSRNNFVLALITLGEGWHNNHHHYPGSVQQGFYWYEVDITYYLLWSLSKVGIVWELNGVPERALHSKRIDGNNLPAE